MIYSDHTIASHVPRITFNAYFRAKSKNKETLIVQELERGFDRRVKEEASRIASLSQAQRRLRDGSQHIIERILQLACPRCGQAFPEVLDGELGFSGCFALTCVRAACGCAFCAYCLEDCGNDAHAHVRTRQCSPYNEGLFPQPAAQKFALAHRRRRQRMLR